jgi:hypothetical protein
MVIGAGALMLVAIAVALTVRSAPKPGSVEWHKKEYLRAYNRIFGARPIDRARKLLPGPRSGEIDENWEALVRLGYLVDRRTSLSSNEARVTIVAFRNATKERFDWNFIQIRSENPLVLTAPREVIDEFDRFLAKQTVPATPRTAK